MARLTSVALGFMFVFFVFGGWTHAHAQDLDAPLTQFLRLSSFQLAISIEGSPEEALGAPHNPF